MSSPITAYGISVLDFFGEIEEYADIPEPVSNLDLRNAIQPPLVGVGCEGCGGRCCTVAFGFTSLSLTRSEAQSLRFVDKAYTRNTWDPDTDDWLYPMTEDCPYREPNGNCGIYEERPYACRGFLCYQQGNYAIEKAIRRQTGLLEHLQRKGCMPPDDGEKLAEIPRAFTREEEAQHCYAQLATVHDEPIKIDYIPPSLIG